MKRTELKRSENPMKRTAIKKRKSKKTRDYEAEFKEVRPVVIARADGRCEARTVNVGGEVVVSRCWKHGTEVHHIKRRSQKGSNDPKNLVLLCGDHHKWIHAHPEMARQLGLLVHSWEGGNEN